MDGDIDVVETKVGAIDRLGLLEGDELGASEEAMDGDILGLLDGNELGASEEAMDGALVGSTSCQACR